MTYLFDNCMDASLVRKSWSWMLYSYTRFLFYYYFMRVKWKIQTIVMEVLLTINLHFQFMILYILLNKWLPWMKEDYWRKTTVNAILIEQHWLLCDLKEQILLTFNDISNYANWSPETCLLFYEVCLLLAKNKKRERPEREGQLACASYVHVSGIPLHGIIFSKDFSLRLWMIFLT